MTRVVREIGDAPLMPGFSLKDIEVADGVVIRVATAGSGTPILLLHGHPHTHIVWGKLAPRLARQFSVVATDLRGFGDSSELPAGNRPSPKRVSLPRLRAPLARGFFGAPFSHLVCQVGFVSIRLPPQ
jgi:pimeloyl-ACP methyl ester carboxylesterase